MNQLVTRQENSLGKAQIVQLLDAMCAAVEPTETQYSTAVERYKTIGDFLAEESSPLRDFEPDVYPQGSMRIRAAIRPVHRREFDVDLVCEFKRTPHSDPKQVKKLVWDRFRSSDRYRDMVVEKNRCIQLLYAGDFHMDIMPCVPCESQWSKQGSVWVPDKKMDDWKPSNPKGFATCVEVVAAKAPKQRITLMNSANVEAANVEPLPAEMQFSKPALIRIIQILKAHRDHFFRNDQGVAPISVIITTLAMHSYDRAVTENTFASVFDLLLEVIQGMPEFIKIDAQSAHFVIENPSHAGENFAEKWNGNSDLSAAFFKWHRIVVSEVKALAEKEAQGLDKVGTVLENSFGTTAANEAIKGYSSSVRHSTAAGRIAVTSSGLVVPACAGIQTASKNPPHNFHGS